MSGTGRVGRSPKETEGPRPAEHHLGDSLAALVDGELGHEARERVLAHLATCQGCRAEADAQRRLKNVFADSAPPAPSDGFLARLQGLPAGPSFPGDDGPGDGARGGPGTGPAQAALSASGSSPFDFGYLPGGRGLPGGRDGHSALSPSRGFRIHRPERGGPSSLMSAASQGAISPGAAPHGSASRGRRLAFAAASAFSMAALALGGGVLGGPGGGAANAGGDNASASPARTSGNSGAASDRDGRRRGGEKQAPVQRQTAARGPLRGFSSPPGSIYPLLHSARFNSPFTAPVLGPAPATSDVPSSALASTPTASTPSALSTGALSTGATGAASALSSPAEYGSREYGSTLVRAPGRSPVTGAGQSAAPAVPQQR